MFILNGLDGYPYVPALEPLEYLFNDAVIQPSREAKQD